MKQEGGCVDIRRPVLVVDLLFAIPLSAKDVAGMLMRSERATTVLAASSVFTGASRQ